MSPELTDSVAGENPVVVIFTGLVAAEPDAGSARTSVAAASMSARFIYDPSYVRASAAVTDSDGVAPAVEVPRSRLVGGDVDAVGERSLHVRRLEDAPRVRTELQLLDRDPLPEFRAALQV